MSELKRHHINEVMDMHNLTRGEMSYSFVYYADDVDRVIAEKDAEIAELKEQVRDYSQGLYVIQARAEKEACHHKYKRCFAMAMWCRSRTCFYDTMRADSSFWARKSDRAYKWHNRWLKLAEKFKPNSTLQQKD